MVFEVKGKVALVTGGASGIGYHTSKKLLELGLKAVTLVDVNDEQGQLVQDEFRNKFGENSCVFVRADVTDESQLEAAFKSTVETFHQLDIVMNNAAIIDEVNWKKCIDVNLVACVSGTKLALDHYLPKYKSGPEGLIINISSIAGLDTMGIVPVYSVTKVGVVALGRSFGTKEHYSRTNVRVITICAGHTETPMVMQRSSSRYIQEYKKFYNVKFDDYAIQKPEFFATSLSKILETGETGSVWLIEGGEPAYEMEFPTRINMRKN